MRVAMDHGLEVRYRPRYKHTSATIFSLSSVSLSSSLLSKSLQHVCTKILTILSALPREAEEYIEP